ncbi:MAG: hypothetical protein NVS1B4_26280 [Gemmatimonadaceae bacterium]
MTASACFGGTLPSRELYRLSLPDTAVAPVIRTAGGNRLLRGSLAIAPYTTPGLYAGSAIVYRVGETQYGAYPSREWAIPLAEMLGILTERVLAREPMTTVGAVYDPPSRRSRTYLWRGVVREFEEVDRGPAVFAAVHLEGSLVRAADDSVVWTGSAAVERRVMQPTMTNVIQTLSLVAGEAVQQLAEQARASLVGGSAALTRP